MTQLEDFECRVEEVIQQSTLSYEEIADSLEFLSQEYRNKASRN